MEALLTRSRALAERSAPILLALESVMGVLQLLDAFHVRYYPTIHRATRTMRFELGISLVVPLALLLTLWLSWMLWKRSARASAHHAHASREPTRSSSSLGRKRDSLLKIVSRSLARKV